MAKIAVDIDDTLYSFTALAREVLAEEALRTGDKMLERAAYAPWTEWRTPPDMLGLEKWLEVVDICHDDDKILSRTPFPGSQNVLDELAAQHDLVYVSNRTTERESATSEWLDIHDFPTGHLVCAGHGDKQAFLNECQYLIDDRPKNLVQFVYASCWAEPEKERVGFGLMTEFNRSLTDVPGIYLAPAGNWSLMRFYFEKTGVLGAVYTS